MKRIQALKKHIRIKEEFHLLCDNAAPVSSTEFTTNQSSATVLKLKSSSIKKFKVMSA